jgi:2-keto-4-pentenoate hydratase/2-oxohepta-3-ene-1,7-dioic acid hydratase in catechol pathway
MKLVSFKAGGKSTFGLIKGDGVVDVPKHLGGAFPDIKSALGAGVLDKIRALESKAADYPLASIEYLPVIPNPDKIFCIGVNYMKHQQEMGRPKPDYPLIFVRFANSQVGAGQPMIRPIVSDNYDYEGELALIIGKTARRVPKERAYECIAGYACYNDGSIRDWQNHTSQFTPGKNFLHSGSFGPWMVTSDEFGDPMKQTLATRLNGQVMQDTPISDLMFDIPALIEYITAFTELVPGDVISTGTPGGVGAARKPPVWMKPGDVVEVDISGIGVLKNPIVAEKA